MKHVIERSGIRTDKMRLKHPYRIAYDHISDVHNVFLKLETSNGIVGYGCAAPDIHVTGEDHEKVVEVFEGTLLPLIRKRDCTRISRIMEKLRKVADKYPSTLAMVDMALHDILGKVTGLPLYRLLGGYRTNIKTSVTVGICSVDDTIDRSRDYVDQGFRAIKIKGGLDVDEDIKRVWGVRKELGPSIELRFDANQGYNAREAIRFVKEVGGADLELIEQPTPTGSPEMLGRVTRKVPIPVMADESLLTLRDAFKLARGDIVDMINIKLMKVGGIEQALHINSVARSAGLETMVGCMDESKLGIAASLHFALAKPNVAYADLDGNLGLIGDPVSGGVVLRRGILYVNEEPGLGVDMTW
mgnify:CR=1 FL=1